MYMNCEIDNIESFPYILQLDGSLLEALTYVGQNRIYSDL